MKEIEFKSSSKKRFELINAILDCNAGTAEEWLEKQGINIEELTDQNIDLLLRAFKEMKQ